ncbi:MAG TPA: molybdopterin converting factor subunit 1 [Anaerolineales bacterium]|nr:molybdopterin converting factor subunit 1 [Anaerolineales bacterium]
MKFKVLFFATVKLRTGVSNAEFDLDIDQPKIQDLLNEVERRYPKIGPSMGTLLVAVNKEFAAKDQIIRDGDELALFPPVSGG